MCLPARISPWIPRNLDCYGVIQILLNDDAKVAMVFGMPGTGKSSIIKKVALYAADRNLYQGGILYVNLQGVELVADALGLIIQKLDQVFKNPYKRMQSLKKMRLDEMLFKIFDMIKTNLKILMVLDNVEDLIQNQGK